MMPLLTTIYLIIAGAALFFLLFPFIKTALSTLVARESHSDKVQNEKSFDYGCIITAYKNADIAVPLIKSLLQQNYDRFTIYLVADACETVDLDIEDDRLVVLHPQPALNLKVKSIIHATEHFVRAHDYTIVFDADNLAHPDFLKEINHYANMGYEAIQGQRTAKNLDTVYACADSIGEFYKNYVERYAPARLGSSSVISGSGMAIERDLYQSYLDSPEIQQGKELGKRMLQEDKILQNHILRLNKRITFAWDAIVYDEKVTTGEAVETQRSRWLFSYFQNMTNALGLIRRGLFNLSYNQLLFGVITIAPPLFILLFGSGVLFLAGLIFAPWMALALFVGLNIFALNIFWTLYLSNVPDKIWESIWGIPLFVMRQVSALTRMGNPDKNFKHTEHNRNIQVDELLVNEPAEQP
ncbi:MAG: glycosyltransferase family 2 protein [Saprospiraceae bacterium]|nr:glycosyltransferase family 2 protein [Saprospiraceae bacterium]